MQDLFVGRGQELGLLHDAGTAAAGGRGGLVLLGGEPGIGKSRLADEYATRVAADGALVAWGRCWELGGAPAYWPWTEALRGVIAQRSAAGADELGQLLPELQQPAVESAPEHAESARFRLFEAVVQFLRMTSTEQPVVVVLEDLHAADEPSLLLLQYVARAGRGSACSRCRDVSGHRARRRQCVHSHLVGADARPCDDSHRSHRARRAATSAR